MVLHSNAARHRIIWRTRQRMFLRMVGEYGPRTRLLSNPAVCYCLSYEAIATFPHGYNKWSAMREMDENYQYS